MCGCMYVWMDAHLRNRGLYPPPQQLPPRDSPGRQKDVEDEEAPAAVRGDVPLGDAETEVEEDASEVACETWRGEKRGEMERVERG